MCSSWLDWLGMCMFVVSCVMFRVLSTEKASTQRTDISSACCLSPLYSHASRSMRRFVVDCIYMTWNKLATCQGTHSEGCDRVTNKAHAMITHNASAQLIRGNYSQHTSPSTCIQYSTRTKPRDLQISRVNNIYTRSTELCELRSALSPHSYAT